MPEGDTLFFRPIHWLIQLCWNYRFYFELLKYIKSRNVNPVEFFLALVDSVEEAPAAVRKLFEDFNREAMEEWFSSTKKK